MKHVLVVTAGLVVVGMCIGCGPQGDEGAAGETPAGVSSPALGLRLVEVPEDLRVVASAGHEIVMEPADPAIAGGVSVAVQDEQGAVNLVAALQDHQQLIEAREAGVYSGKQELVGPFGPAFLSRGRWQAEDGPREEILLFTLHPTRNAMVVIEARHPAGDDSGWRANLVLGLLGRLEALDEPAGES